MKIVWVVNMPIGALAKKLNASADSGSWLSVALDNVKNTENEYYIVTTCNVKETISIKENNVTFVALSLGAPISYRHTERNRLVWKQLFEEISPDIVQIWGTEYQHALSAATASPENCKTLLYVQGIMDTVYENYFGGISKGELLRYTSPVEVVMGKSLFSARKNAKRCAENEKKIMQLIDGIITETEWSKAHYRLTADCKSFYFDPLCINKAFVDSNRREENVVPHTVFAPASNYPLKGGHNLIKAIALVKKEFDLWDNVEFVGILPQTEMAKQMEKAEVFVCSSKIEHQSSTLREAMFVGMPCISTCVGGIPEVLENGRNGELYAFEDYIALAGKITKLFGDKEYAKKLSENARKTMIEYYKNNLSDMLRLYGEG